MNTTERLLFRLLIAEPNTAERIIRVCPRYDGLKLKWSRPSGQMYYTEDISGTLKFLGVDFHAVNACALNTQFTLIVYQNKIEVGRSLFRKTDCKWDIDHEIVEVDISVYDEYKKFQDKKDDEYNLVKIVTNKRPLNFYVYPYSELYIQGDSKLYAFAYNDSKGIAVNVENPTTDGDILSSQFGPATRGFTRSGYIESGTYAGKYVGTTDYADTQMGSTAFYYMYRVGGTYAIEFQFVADPVASDTGRRRWDVSLVNINTNTVITTVTGVMYQYSSDKYPTIATLTSVNFGVGYPVLQVRCWVPWGRLVSQGEIGSLIVDNIRGSAGKMYYQGRYNFVTISTNEAETGDYRIENTNMYYAPPTNTDEWVPVYTESWYRGISIWVSAIEVRTVTGNTYRNRPWDVDISNNKKKAIVNDFYTLGDAIKAVVNKIDENIVFVPDAEHSQFLFSPTNPISGETQGKLYISQKSNILNLGYDYPAWMAPVKWSQIETLLREAFDCYWSLYTRNGQTHLRIEHRRWYENGGSYTQSGVQVASIDLTSTYRNGTPFTFGEKTRHWEFDTDGNGTVSTASRHEYGWMDTQSEIFDGQPITVPEAYRLFTDEKVEQHKVDWFSSDIDFLTSVQAECSSDGFALVMENPNRPNWIITGAPQYSGQNYQLSFDYLQDKYLLQGIYAEYIKIGDNATLTATGSNARMRTSEVKLRSLAGMTIDAGDTIKTAVGIGVIDTLEYDMHSELYTAKIRYENE